MLYAILIVSTLAVIGAGIAFHYRVKKHMSASGETTHAEELRPGDVAAPGEKQ
ncbi:MAG TPA: hypothetical protein VF135_01085 [Terriglobales bacterium]